MRFLADMGVSPRFVKWLRTEGHDAIHLFEQKLHRLSDSDILVKAKNENRILLTMDLDFSRLLSRAKDNELVTVVIFRLSDQRPQNIQTRFPVLLPVIEKCIEEGVFILSVNDNQIRIRKLPIIYTKSQTEA